MSDCSQEMQPIGADELAGLQAGGESTMLDQCRIEYHDRTGPVDNHGKPTKVPVAPVTKRCGFRPGGGREVQNGSERSVSDASIRLPVGTEIDNLDVIVLTQRFGRPVPEQRYNVIGMPRYGPTAIILTLQGA